ncbi:glycosyltransferase family 2 protein [Chromobacterium sp. IIBBL 290-4]|uniref:glycosyltransferase family 2 protein n=1 Tax=Chromobacterium sp. IIBBL 290-4 TaxID=2953890 RepID=UPI0020B63C2F|nr:hypothetical protein [Chromobacterium sp. IIBBL 290-4]UTH74390.1 hypothetical protein NKT35_23090 [Chromobacterium sp. IIBBL 290-4]
MTATSLILTVRNASRYLDVLLPALASQTLKPDEWLALDCESADGCGERLRAAGAQVMTISAREFNRGGIRGLASRLVGGDVLIFLTQGAIPADPDCLRRLRDAVWMAPDIGMAYGRTLPQGNTGSQEACPGLFDYPAASRTKRLSDAAELGVKTCLVSDACCAYRRVALETVGGFPADVICAEETHVAGRMLLAGWALRYDAEARVCHARDSSLLGEVRRCFDLGVFYGREIWIAEHFGRAGRAELRFIRSESAGGGGRWWRPGSALLRAALKSSGYRLGQMERLLPKRLKRRLSLSPGYWG